MILLIFASCFLDFCWSFWLIFELIWRQQDVAEACGGPFKASEEQERGADQADEAGVGAASGDGPRSNRAYQGSFLSHSLYIMGLFVVLNI